MSKCRYRCGVCAGEGGRGRSVPVQGTAGEGGILKDCRHSLLHSARHIQRTTFLDLANYCQAILRGDLIDRNITDLRKSIVFQGSPNVRSMLWRPAPTCFLEPLSRNHPETIVLLACPLLLAIYRWVDALAHQSLGFQRILPRIGQGGSWKHSDRECLFLAMQAVLQPPVSSAIRLKFL